MLRHAFKGLLKSIIPVKNDVCIIGDKLILDPPKFTSGILHIYVIIVSIFYVSQILD